MKVYLICRQCEDQYYDGHPTRFAFLKKEDADSWIAAHVNPDDEDPWYYVKVVEAV